MLSRIQSTQTLFELLKHVNTNQKFYLTQVQWATTLQIYLQVIPSYIKHFHLISYQKLYTNGNVLRINLSNSVRVVLGRFGLILSDDGGALEMMELPYRLYVGENSALEDNGTRGFISMT